MGRYAIVNKRMLLAILIAVIVMGQTYIQYWTDLPHMEVLTIITFPMAAAMFGRFAAIYPAVPYALSFAEEYNTTFYRYVLLRSNKYRYIFEKIKNTAYSGAVMMGVSFSIIFIIAIIVGKPVDVQSRPEQYISSIWYSNAAVWGGKYVLLCKIFLACLFGAIWSNICLLFTLIFLNRYVAFISTYILYHILWQVLPESRWNPVYLLRADASIYVNFADPTGRQLLILCLICLLNGFVMYRKLKYE